MSWHARQTRWWWLSPRASSNRAGAGRLDLPQQVGTAACSTPAPQILERIKLILSEALHNARLASGKSLKAADAGRYRDGTYRGRRWCGSAFSAPTIRCTSSSVAAQAARSAGSKRSSARRSSRRRRVLTCRTTRRPASVSSSVTTLRLPGSAPRTRCPEACSRPASLVTEEPCTPSARAHCVELERPCSCSTSSRRNWESEISNASTLRSASPTRSRVATSKATSSLADVVAGSPCPIPGSMARGPGPRSGQESVRGNVVIASFHLDREGADASLLELGEFCDPEGYPCVLTRCGFLPS
jgi:hypothetical protein